MTKCPFLNLMGRCPIRNLGNSLMFFMRLCPVIGRALHSSSSSNSPGVVIPVAQKRSAPSSEFIKDNRFDYEAFAERKIEEKIDNGTYRVFKRINRMAKSFPNAKNYSSEYPDLLANDSYLDSERNVTVWCSNDYLGMSKHSKVVENAIKTIYKLGIGAGGTRNISGNSIYHERLEQQLADWYRKPAGLIFTSCYVANATSLLCLAQQLPDCVIFSDAGNHASMIEGIRNSRVPKFIFRHNDPEHLESLLCQQDVNIPKIVAFESINSMSGSVAPIRKLCDIAHKYGAITFIDEVHAVGLYGKRGSGLGEAQGCLDQMDIISGTLGKAVGAIGGFIVGSRNIVDMIRSYGSGFIFTTSLPPVVLESASSSIRVLQSDEGEELRYHHQKMAYVLRTNLVRKGFPIFPSKSHIVPLHVGDAKLCRKVSDQLLDKHGIYVQAINYPTVSFGTERLRFAPTPAHTPRHVEALVNGLSSVWQDTGLNLLHRGCSSGSCGCEHVCDTFSSEITLPECISMRTPAFKSL